jgi:ubiquinone/menaquinone biosynthesis C-methylase UbiE
VGQDITEAMLRKGKAKIPLHYLDSSISLNCSDAMALPFADHSFDLVVSGLASHHMNIKKMLSEMNRVLKPGGILSFIDVGTSPFWESTFMQGVSRVFTFFYFLIKEDLTRARMEASDLSNLLTPKGWKTELKSLNFYNIGIEALESKYKFLPSPLIISCTKST